MRWWYAFAPQWIISKLHCLLFVYASGEMWFYNAEKAEFGCLVFQDVIQKKC